MSKVNKKDMTKHKQSYTSKLTEYLEENGISDEVLNLIRTFASEQAEKIKNERKEQEGKMHFGKYKGKSIQDIFKLDPRYIKWLSTNDKYLHEEQRELVNNIMKTLE